MFCYYLTINHEILNPISHISNCLINTIKINSSLLPLFKTLPVSKIDSSNYSQKNKKTPILKIGVKVRLF